MRALPRHREPSVFDRADKKTWAIPSEVWTAQGAAGFTGGVWEERRNGLPVRLYVYRGTGRDAYDGTCLFEELAS